MDLCFQKYCLDIAHYPRAFRPSQMGFTLGLIFKMRRLTPKNTKKGLVPNQSGIYILYNQNNKPIYVGHSRRLRHRISSYHQQDSFKAHPTKRLLIESKDLSLIINKFL